MNTTIATTVVIIKITAYLYVRDYRIIYYIIVTCQYTTNISTISAPLRMLLSKNQAWLWGPDQSDSYRQLQNELTAPKVLRHYDPQAPTKISADASSYGIGAVLL